MTHTSDTAIRCPYCPRTFATPEALANHMRVKRRTSAPHGLGETGEPRRREEITAALEVATNG